MTRDNAEQSTSSIDEHIAQYASRAGQVLKKRARALRSSGKIRQAEIFEEEVKKHAEAAQGGGIDTEVIYQD